MAMDTHVMKMKLIQLTPPKILPFNFTLPKFIVSVLVRGCGRWELKYNQSSSAQLNILWHYIRFRFFLPETLC